MWGRGSIRAQLRGVFHNLSPVVVISVVTELRKEKGKEGGGQSLPALIGAVIH